MVGTPSDERCNNIDPGRDIDFLMARTSRMSVIEDFGGSAGNRTEAGVTQHPDYSGFSMRVRRAPYIISIGEKRMDVDVGKMRLYRDKQIAILKAGMSGLMPPCMQTSVAPRATSSATFATMFSSEWSYASDSHFWRLKPELASDEADIGEVNVAIDDIGDFLADVFGAREVGRLDDGAQIVAGPR